MKTCLKNIAYLFLLASFMISCSKQDEYPVIPQIEFLGMTKIFDPGLNRFDRGVLSISFKDGDGDIGLRDSDVLPPYDFNFFVRYYELQNGQEVRVIVTDSNEFSARIPILTPLGSVKAIKGEIEDTLNIYNPLSIFDTIKFEAYLVDRALNKSNTITTGWFLRN